MATTGGFIELGGNTIESFGGIGLLWEPLPHQANFKEGNGTL